MNTCWWSYHALHACGIAKAAKVTSVQPTLVKHHIQHHIVPYLHTCQFEKSLIPTCSPLRQHYHSTTVVCMAVDVQVSEALTSPPWSGVDKLYL